MNYIDKIPITESSGNVFKDLGSSNPEERLVKARITQKINSVIKKKRLNQIKVSKILGTPPFEISLLNKGIVAEFSLEKLLIFLKKLKKVE